MLSKEKDRKDSRDQKDDENGAGQTGPGTIASLWTSKGYKN
jgi:hypothetical protein